MPGICESMPGICESMPGICESMSSICESMSGICMSGIRESQKADPPNSYAPAHTPNLLLPAPPPPSHTHTPPPPLSPTNATNAIPYHTPSMPYPTTHMPCSALPPACPVPHLRRQRGCSERVGGQPGSAQRGGARKAGGGEDVQRHSQHDDCSCCYCRHCCHCCCGGTGWELGGDLDGGS